MDIRHLKYFLEVARQKSFTRAAETLHVSQSAISKMIKDLEEELGFFLFNRSSKQIQLTDTGDTFLTHAQEVVTLFNNLSVEVESAAKLDKGKVVIGLPPITGSTRFAQLLGEFKKKYQQIDIALFEYGSKTIELGIQDGSIDIGIICNLPDSNAYHSFALSNDPLWVVASPENPISSLSEVGLAELSNEQFVMYRQDFSLHHAIVNNCIAAGFQPSIIFETSQRELMTQLVATNLGVAILPSKTCAELDPKSIRAIPLVRPQIHHQMSIIWKKGRHLNRAALLWIEFARQFLPKIPA
jgi:DNA-binding transcriptional LysR family regulator